jgi:hypothetical protein
MNDDLARQNANCVRAVASALTVDPGLIEFLRQLAPQWGSSTGKTRSYSGLNKAPDASLRCIVRVDSRAAILLNDAMYGTEGPSRLASMLADALRNPRIDEDGTRCRIQAADLPAIEIRIDQYSDANGNPVDPRAPGLHHRVVSITPA